MTIRGHDKPVETTEEKSSVRLKVNGDHYELKIGDQFDEVSPSQTLAHTLRETLGLRYKGVL